MGNRRRVLPPPPPSPRPSLDSKLRNVISCHEEVKLAFQQLRSQIENGLIEARDVFESLAIPLKKLIGLKTVEMAEEGRFSTIFVDPHVSGPSTSASGSGHSQIHMFMEENFTTKASREGKQLVDKQKMDLLKLIRILKGIKIQANSSEDDLLKVLADLKVSLRSLFEQAIAFMETIPCQNQETTRVGVNLLKMLFKKVGLMLCTVEDGVQKLVQDIADQMFHPMVEYVKGVKIEVEKGTCAQLLASLEEVDEAMRHRRMELEEAKRNTKIAEERKIQALIRLRETEERERKATKCLELVSKAQKRSKEHFASQLLMGVEEEHTRKRTCRKPLESPIGASELFRREPGNNGHGYPTRGRNLISPQTPPFDIRIPLGPSPSLHFNGL